MGRSQSRAFRADPPPEQVLRTFSRSSSRPVFLLTIGGNERKGNRSVSFACAFAVTRRDPAMFSEKVLEGKKILITGGGTGIGKSLGGRFLELGAEIVI